MKGSKSIRLAIVGVLAFAIVGCGTLSKAYCESTDPAFREVIKRELVNVGVDYCTTRGLIDAIKVIKATESNDSASIKTNSDNVAVIQNQNFERQHISEIVDNVSTKTNSDNVAVVQNLNFERQQYTF